MDGWVNRWMNGWYRQMTGWMVQMDGWMVQIDRYINGWMDG